MKRLLRWVGFGLAGVVGLVVLGLVIAFPVSEYKLRSQNAEVRQLAVSTDPTIIAHGKRLSQAYGCTACHGPTLEGEALVELPDGSRLHAINLTRLSTHSNEQLEVAIRQGIGQDGRALAIMPAVYGRMTDEDVSAIISFLRTLKPIGNASPERTLGPLARANIATGLFATTPAQIEQASSMEPYWAGKEHQQGRYLAGVTCAECHNFDLGGREDEAPDLSIASAYDAEAFRRLMRTGVGAGNRQLGAMSAASKNHFSKFTDDEIRQLHGYLIARAEKVSAR